MGSPVRYTWQSRPSTRLRSRTSTVFADARSAMEASNLVSLPGSPGATAVMSGLAVGEPWLVNIPNELMVTLDSFVPSGAPTRDTKRLSKGRRTVRSSVDTTWSPPASFSTRYTTRYESMAPTVNWPLVRIFTDPVRDTPASEPTWESTTPMTTRTTRTAPMTTTARRLRRRLGVMRRRLGVMRPPQQKAGAGREVRTPCSVHDEQRHATTAQRSPCRATPELIRRASPSLANEAKSVSATVICSPVGIRIACHRMMWKCCIGLPPTVTIDRRGCRTYPPY